MADVSAPERTAELWSRLSQRIEAVRSLVLAVDDDAWGRRCEAEGWSLALVACHVTLGLRRQAKWVSRAIAGRPPHAFDWERTHALNALVARRDLLIRRQDVLTALSDAADRWRALVTSASEAELGRPAFRYRDRVQTLEWVMAALAPRHIDEHLRSIRRTLDADR